MKQRLLVMNGQRIVQTAESNGVFAGEHYKVTGKAEGLKPGVYNLYSAVEADKTKVLDGQIIHSDGEAVYQKVNTNLVKHNRASFDKVPEIASIQSIMYDGDKALASPPLDMKQSRRLAR
ncbi:KfrB domain-containing protein [Escherichia coli]|nr:conjugal transfer protein TraO [Escherichia coli]